MGNASTSAAWTAAPLDECLDKLGTCESTVSECETRTFILEAQIALLRHPEVVIGLACGVAVLLLLSLYAAAGTSGSGRYRGRSPGTSSPDGFFGGSGVLSAGLSSRLAPACSVLRWRKGWRGLWTRWPSALTAQAPSTPPSGMLLPSPPSGASRLGPYWECSGPKHLPPMGMCLRLRRPRRRWQPSITARRRGRCRLCRRGP
jgi:hypothetical protein